MREINLRSRVSRTKPSIKTEIRRSEDESYERGEKKGSKIVILSVIALVLAVVVLGAVIIYGVIFTKSDSLKAIKIDQTKYYAVFLTNGQVYFGHLKNYNTQNPELSDIYYLQLAQSPQASSEGQKTENQGEQKTEGQVLEQPNQTGDQQDQGLTLIKLGEELHGPEDAMVLNRDQVLFVEKLKNDGKVAKAIDDYKNKKKEEKK